MTLELSLVKKHSKKVFELRPRMDWDKGRAAPFILSQLDLDVDNVLPLYLGDDVSDEDAWQWPRRVDPLEVERFLTALTTLEEVVF